MKVRSKKTLIFVFSVITILLIFGTSAVCNICTADMESSDTTTDDELAETNSGITTTGSATTSDTATATTSGEPQAPEIVELDVFMGPEYSEVSGFCFYRIEAIVTGNPVPDIVFSKDDSAGAWGDNICQVNIEDPSDTYTLTVTATNSEGEDEATHDFIWECDEEVEPEDTIELEEPGVEFEINRMILHPSDIGYIVYPEGVNTSTLIIGDSISNTDVRGYFAFDLSPLEGETLLRAEIMLQDYTPFGDPSFKGEIKMGIHGYLPLEPDDYEDPAPVFIGWKNFENDEDPLSWDISSWIEFVQDATDEGVKWQCRVHYSEPTSDDDEGKDGREYTRDDISLIIYHE